MTLTELRYIIAVARERHFGRAADACFVSQPTLSIAVKKLEDELGIALFERGNPDITVTPAGQLVIQQAEITLAEAQKIKTIARAARDPLSRRRGRAGRRAGRKPPHCCGAASTPTGSSHLCHQRWPSERARPAC